MYGKWDLNLSSGPSTHSCVPQESPWDPARDTRPGFSCFLSSSTALASQESESDATTGLRPCCHPRQREANFHWQTGAWSNSVERDEIAEQSKFLSFPHLSANILENTLEREKNVLLSQSMSALNARCSAAPTDLGGVTGLVFF